MIEWGKVPWSLWVYAAFNVVGVILIEVQAHGPIPAKVLFPFVMFAWLFFLFRGVRWVWIATVGLIVLGFAGDLISGSFTLRGIVMGLISPALLLLPVTRRYFASEAEVVAG
jgi:hypothetical protein